ncbi:hypothetical protein [Leptospira interrogans]|uniref:hypothetical protein n=1 Tax=Leptospira interrogans TaxID=173 RepID=UPI001F10C58F|nr:hypothetical protein [Leptospira interrogans]UMQ56618.1 hypothetical protein FH585_01495 [Leptospira interrogans]UNE69233.1 hypothetical protein FH588_22985 [Leptospira interrogans]
MKRILSIIIILLSISCASYSERVEQNKIDLYRAGKIVEDSNLSKKDKVFVIETLQDTKKLLNKGVSESILADKWRDYLFSKWLAISLFVLGIVTLLVFKVKSWVSWIPNFSIFNSGGQNARSTT